MQYQQETDYTKRLDAGLWRRLLGYMKPYHKYLYGVMALMCLTALMDAIFPLLTREAIDKLIASDDAAARVSFALRYGCVILVQTASIFSFCSDAGRCTSRRAVQPPSA